MMRTLLLLLLTSAALCLHAEEVRSPEFWREHDRTIQQHLVGVWVGPKSSVRLTSERVTFRMGDFTYDGPVTYDRSYAGYFVEFLHRGRKHIFIISAHLPGWDDRNKAHATVAHDVERYSRETDIGADLRRVSANKLGSR